MEKTTTIKLRDLNTRDKRQENFKRMNTEFKQFYWKHKSLSIDDESGIIKLRVDYGLKQAKEDGYEIEYREMKAQDKRTYQLRKKIEKICSTGNALFVTFTFNDEMLQREEKNLIRLVKKYLKEESRLYIANIDYGGKNGRFHLHAIVLPKLESLDLKKWRDYAKNSNINVKRVRINDQTSIKKLARYITKLTRHTIKENGKLERVIFSRGFKKPIELNDYELPF